MSLISSLIDRTSRMMIAPLASRAKAKMQERENSKRTAANYKAAEHIRSQWLEALMHDALLIGYGETDCSNTLNAGAAGVMFAAYGFGALNKDKPICQYLIDTVLMCQEGVDKYKGNIPEKMAGRIAAGMITAREHIASFMPITIIEASHVFASRHPTILEKGYRQEREALTTCKKKEWQLKVSQTISQAPLQRLPHANRTHAKPTQLVTFGTAN